MRTPTINSQELNKFTSDFLDPNLQHSNLTLEDLKNHVDCVESVYQIYENFLNDDQPHSVENINLKSTNNLFHTEINPNIDELKFQDSLATEINEIAHASQFLVKEISNLVEDRKKLNLLLNENTKIMDIAKKEIHDLHERIKSNATHISLLEANLRNMETSLSWRLTQPLRSVIKLIR